MQLAGQGFLICLACPGRTQRVSAAESVAEIRALHRAVSDTLTGIDFAAGELPEAATLLRQ